MSTISSGTTLTTALVQTGDTTGELVIKTDNGNTTAATFTTAGNLVVGTTSASAKIHAQSSADNEILSKSTAAEGRFAVDYYGAGGYGSYFIRRDGATKWRMGVVGDSSASPGLNFYQEGSGSRMFIDSSGNVGIGTSSPDVVSNYRTLNINGTTGGIFYFKSNGTNVAQVSGDSTGATLYTLGSQDLLFGTNNIERGRFDTAGNFRFNSGYGSVATAYGCRAWVNFNGTGTVAIRASGNVSSITDNGTGQYTMNFTNAMPDANYSVSGSSSNLLTSSNTWITPITYSASSIRFYSKTFDNQVADREAITVEVFR